MAKVLKVDWTGSKGIEGKDKSAFVANQITAKLKVAGIELNGTLNVGFKDSDDIKITGYGMKEDGKARSYEYLLNTNGDILSLARESNPEEFKAGMKAFEDFRETINPTKGESFEVGNFTSNNIRVLTSNLEETKEILGAGKGLKGEEFTKALTDKASEIFPDDSINVAQMSAYNFKGKGQTGIQIIAEAGSTKSEKLKGLESSQSPATNSQEYAMAQAKKDFKENTPGE